MPCLADHGVSSGMCFCTRSSYALQISGWKYFKFLIFAGCCARLRCSPASLRRVCRPATCRRRWAGPGNPGCRNPLFGHRCVSLSPITSGAFEDCETVNVNTGLPILYRIPRRGLRSLTVAGSLLNRSAKVLCIVSKVLLLVIEFVSKKQSLTAEYSSIGREELGGFFNKTLFLWLWELLRLGNSTVLSLKDLYPLEDELLTKTLAARFDKS